MELKRKPIPKPVCKIGKRINEPDADKWVDAYKRKHPKGPWGFLFGKELLENMLNDDDCDGLWFFLGQDDDATEPHKKTRMVIYKADADGKIMKKSGMGSLGAKEKEDDPGDEGSVCPPECP